MENLNIQENIRELVIKVLNQTEKPRHKKAAKILGVSERTLFRYKSDFNIIRRHGEYMVGKK